MKYKGQELLTPPTVELIRSYIILHNSIIAKPQDVFDYWESKQWKTKKGTEVKTLETAVDVYNGIVVNKIRMSEKQARKEQVSKKVLENRKVVILPPGVSGKNCKSIKDVSGKILLRSCNREQNKNNIADLELKYYDQLDDPRWHAFRRFILAVRGCKCEICGNENTLQIHHPQYMSNRKAWEYTCKEVVVLCRECHRKIHNKPQ